MVKIKMRVNLCVIFSLSCFIVGGFGSSDFLCKNFVPNQNSECSFTCEDFRVLEQKNRQLETSVVESNKKLTLLKKDVDEIQTFLYGDKFLQSLQEYAGEKGGIGTKGEKGQVQAQVERPTSQTGQDGGKLDQDLELYQTQSKVVAQEKINQTLAKGQPGPKRGQSGQSGQPGQGHRGRDPRLSSLKSCSDVLDMFPAAQSTKLKLYPHGNSTKVKVLCDFESDGGGWTLIQKRSVGRRYQFNKTWSDYVNGFGSLDENFWLGLENIHALTKNGDQELRIELEDFQGNKKWTKYSSFSISGASDFYRLNISGFSPDSTAGDSMTYSPGLSNNGLRFSTSDKENDPEPLRNCGEEYKSGWWFSRACGLSYLNGVYETEGLRRFRLRHHHRGIIWATWRGLKYSLAKTEMKIRTRWSKPEFT